jgi:hypothetical protein
LLTKTTQIYTTTTKEQSTYSTINTTSTDVDVEFDSNDDNSQQKVTPTTPTIINRPQRRLCRGSKKLKNPTIKKVTTFCTNRKTKQKVYTKMVEVINTNDDMMLVTVDIDEEQGNLLQPLAVSEPATATA